MRKSDIKFPSPSDDKGCAGTVGAAFLLVLAFICALISALS